jgi:hypothetical protein
MPENPTGAAAELRSGPVAGWGDDPVLERLRALLEDGWAPVAIAETRADDTVTVERDEQRQELSSDHIAFHRFVEGLKEDHPELRG